MRAREKTIRYNRESKEIRDETGDYAMYESLRAIEKNIELQEKRGENKKGNNSTKRR